MRALWLAGAWGVLIAVVVLSVMPAPPSPDFESSDKAGHVLAYAALMGSFAVVYTARRPPLAIAFIALGIALEFVQGLLGYRSLEVTDMLANTLGVLLGWTGAVFARKMMRRKVVR